MTQDKLLPEEEESSHACHLCVQSKDGMYEDVCADCVQVTLQRLWPQLKRTLENRYGEMLDIWLARGRLHNVRWIVETDFRVSPERMQRFIRAFIKDAVMKEEIELELPYNSYWKPIRLNQLLEALYEQSDKLTEYITGWLIKSVNNAPTEEAERELIRIAWGKRRVAKRYLREEAIMAVAENDALPLQIAALLNIRYRVDKGSSLYLDPIEGEISSVWNEIRESLPAEISALICKDNSF